MIGRCPPRQVDLTRHAPHIAGEDSLLVIGMAGRKIFFEMLKGQRRNIGRSRRRMTQNSVQQDFFVLNPVSQFYISRGFPDILQNRIGNARMNRLPQLREIPLQAVKIARIIELAFAARKFEFKIVVRAITARNRRAHLGRRADQCIGKQAIALDPQRMRRNGGSWLFL